VNSWPSPPALTDKDANSENWSCEHHCDTFRGSSMLLLTHIFNTLS
jgi:hypothetical protein